MRQTIQKGLLITLGWLCVFLGVIGIMLPLLPTTPFLIAALAIFSKSSERFHQMLLNNQWFGPILRQWEANKTISRKSKHKAILLVILTFGISITILNLQGWVAHQIFLLCLAAILLFFIWRIPEEEYLESLYRDTHHCYECIADIYNKEFSDEIYYALPLLENILLENIKPPATMLDLFCGSGQTAEKLSKKGYSMWGVDGSYKLIHQAKTNCENGRFVHADARSFQLNRQFDAVISIGEGINHILSERELRQLFHRVLQHLVPGGVFVFDAATPERFLGHWSEFNLTHKDSETEIKITADYQGNNPLCPVNIIYKRKRWYGWKTDQLRQVITPHETSMILALLRETGFSNIECIDTVATVGKGTIGRPYYRAEVPEFT